MKSALLFAAACLALVAFKLPAATSHYVDAGGTNAVSPYIDWSTAATNIQDAVDASTDGDLVLVTNGVYAGGGRAIASYDVTNRVCMTNAVTVRSVNGPAVTVIQGYQVPGMSASPGAVRCAALENGALLSGFTLTNGGAGTGNDVNGGGVEGWSSVVVSNCVLVGNICAGAGGGADHVTLINCVLTGNQAGGGGAASWAALVNCTITNNSAGWAGGILSSKATNCLVANNSATNYGGGSGYSTLVNSTVSGNVLQPGSGGTGGGSSHDTLMNCIVYNNNAPTGSNYYSSTMTYCCTAPLPGGMGNITNAPLFVDLASGNFHLQSNSPCINSGNNGHVASSTDLEGNPRIVGGTVDMGAYEFQGNIRYVSLSSTNPVVPYSDWSIAATNIQDAVDATAPGETVLVTNGVYATGGRLYVGMTNRVAITNAITLKSINGPGVTVIQGCPVIGTNAVRCVWLNNGALLSGFTITNGATLGATGDSKTSQNGGGVYCATSGSVISNCVVSGNAAYGWGGGVDGGTLNNCKLYGNSAVSGGGAYFANLNNCALFGNSASSSGGGAVRGTLNNCTLVGNTASAGGGVDGSSDGRLNNCVIYSNSAAVDPNYTGIYTFHFTLNYCCTVPLATNGVGNITNDPAFVHPTNGDFQLQATSRCINAGNSTYVVSGTDLDGSPRIMGGTVDMGAYEYQAQVTGTFSDWLQQYNLPTDGSADSMDFDGDRMVNWQEWIAGTIPNNRLSVLLMTSAASTNASSGITVSWQSVNTRTYFLQRASNLSVEPAFSLIQSNIVGQAGTTSYTDVSATNGIPYFYRVGVQ